VFVVVAGLLLFLAVRMSQDARRSELGSFEASVIDARIVRATAVSSTVYELTYRVAIADRPSIERTESVPVAIWEAATAAGRVRVEPRPGEETRIRRVASDTAIGILAVVGLVLLLPALALGITGVRGVQRARRGIPDPPPWGAELLARLPFWTLFGSIWLLVGLPFILLVGYFIWEDRQLAVASRTVSGVVLAKAIARSDNGSGPGRFRHSVHYRFEAGDGRILEDTSEVPEAMSAVLVEREPVPIQYVPGRPRLHRIAGTNRRGELALFGGIGLLIAGAGALIVRADWRRRRRAVRLRDAGIRALATVVQVDALRIRVNQEHLRRIRYQYQDLEHRTHRGVAYVTAEEAERWKPGDKAAILFDPARPRSVVWVGEATE